MCFSANASFGVAAILLPAGAFCVQSAVRKNLAYLPLALTPLAFSLQQASEGLVWVGLDHTELELVQSASLFYLLFALFFWPFWIPFAVLFLQSCWKKRIVIATVALLGLAGGLGLYLPLLTNPDLVETKIVSHSMQYEFEQSPALALLSWTVWKVLYLAVISIPILMSEQKEVVVVGVVLIVLAVASHMFNAYAFVSVWCFFAASLSLYLCYFFLRVPPRTAEAQAPC
jgi:hypothetical protein